MLIHLIIPHIELYADFAAATASSPDAPDLVMIEGLFALYLPQIRKRADLKLFVDLLRDERLLRRIDKFMAFGQTKQEITDRSVRFRHNELVELTRWHADMIVKGVLDRDKAEEIILFYIHANLRGKCHPSN